MPFFKKKPSKESKAKLESRLHTAKHAPDSVIDLSECELNEIPEGTYCLCRVLLKEVLIMHTNRLVDLTERGNYKDFIKLSTVRVLDIHTNHIVSLPDELNNWTQLQVLNIASNKLKSIPCSIGRLKHLQTLNVRDNQIQELPAELGDLSSLRNLDVSLNSSLVSLPKNLALCRCLESLVVDAHRMHFPSSDVCIQGTESIMTFLCKQAGVEYVHPSTTIINVLKPHTARSSLTSVVQDQADLNSRSLSYCSGMDSITAAVMLHERAKEERRKQQLELDKQMLMASEAQTRLLVNASNNRTVLIDAVTKQQVATDREISRLSMKKNEEQKKLLNTIKNMEHKANDVIKEMLQFNELARKTESMLEKEDERRMAENEWIKVRLEEYERLRKQDVQRSMQLMMGQSFSIDHLSDKQTQNHVTDSLANRDREMKRLLDELTVNETFQRNALQALMFQRDAKTARINQQIDLIQKELAQLSMVELQQRQARTGVNQKVLLSQRQDLTALLVQLIDEKDRRSSELKLRLREMEEERVNCTADYWMVQYQRLLDSKPQCVVDLEQKLDIDVVKVLSQSNAMEYLPLFARHRIDAFSLRQLTEEDLQRMGVYQKGLRVDLMSKISALIEKDKFGLPVGSKTKCSESVLAPSAPIPGTDQDENGAQAFEKLTRAHFEVECVICLNLKSSVVFVPCGHICCCDHCSVKLVECPLCREPLKQKLLLADGPELEPDIRTVDPDPTHPNAPGLLK